jgi:hypothetical protein
MACPLVKGTGSLVLLSLCYLVLRRLLQLAALWVRSDQFKEFEIVVLRHELLVLRRRRKRPPLPAADRLFLTAASRRLPLRQLALVPGDTGNVASQASPFCSETLDVTSVGWTSH